MEIIVRGKAKGSYTDALNGHVTIKTNPNVKTSCHEQTFKNADLAARYLDWLFGSGKWEVR
jgi:hypothetical protein